MPTTEQQLEAARAMPRLNPDRPRCAWCDAPFRNQSDLIAHQFEHRGSAEELASGLEQAADTGLRAQAGVAQRGARSDA
jgi:hypothetical protein